MLRKAIILSTFFLILPTIVEAAPPQLYGKSVIVSWQNQNANHRPGRAADGGFSLGGILGLCQRRRTPLQPRQHFGD